MKRRIQQLRLDNHRFKDGRGHWIKDFKGTKAPAAAWQISKLVTLGYDRSAMSGLRFQVANKLINQSSCKGRNGIAPQAIEGHHPAQEQEKSANN